MVVSQHIINAGASEQSLESENDEEDEKEDQEDSKEDEQNYQRGEIERSIAYCKSIGLGVKK